MGRFFKTSNNDYSIDYGFNPDLKDIIPLVQGMQKEADENMEKLSILGDVPVDYIDEHDRENALALKNEYESARDNLIPLALNSPNAGLKLKAGIRAIQGKLKQDIETGRIKRLADNKKHYEDKQAFIQKMSDPYSREIATQALKKMMEEGSPYGTLDKKLQLGEFYEKRNLWEDFTKSGAFQVLKADAKASGIDYVNGMWIDSKTGSVTELPVAKIQGALKHFIEQEIPGYGRYMQDYGGQRFYNEDGTLDWTSKNSELKKLLNVAYTAAYKQTSSEHRKQVNPYSVAEHNHRLSNKGNGGGSGTASEEGILRTSGVWNISEGSDSNIKFKEKFKKELKDYTTSSYSELYKKALQANDTGLISRLKDFRIQNISHKYSNIEDSDLDVLGFDIKEKSFNKLPKGDRYVYGIGSDSNGHINEGGKLSFSDFKKGVYEIGKRELGDNYELPPPTVLIQDSGKDVKEKKKPILFKYQIGEKVFYFSTNKDIITSDYNNNDLNNAISNLKNSL